MRVEDLFDSEAFKAVEAAVREAERTTSGEIVPKIVARSDDYPGVRAIAAAVTAFAAGVLVLAAPIDPRLWLPPALLAVFALAYTLAGRPPVLRLLIPQAHRAAAVDRAARLAFLNEGVLETRDRTGILIYVSLLEHQVEVIADRGIHEHVAPGTWDGVVQTILDGIREGRAEEGLVAAVRHCGELLAERFPPRPDDTDELPNRIRT